MSTVQLHLERELATGSHQRDGTPEHDPAQASQVNGHTGTAAERVAERKKAPRCNRAHHQLGYEGIGPKSRVKKGYRTFLSDAQWRDAEKRRLKKFYDPDPETGCWIWKGAMRRQYGVVKSMPRDGSMGRMIAAHAYSLMIHKNVEFKSGELCCHTCDNPPCVNPDHLFPGTTLDNAQDRERKGRGRRASGEENGASKLNSDAVREIKARIVEGMSSGAIARNLGVGRSTIDAIKDNRTWRSVAWPIHLHFAAAAAAKGEERP